MLREQVVLNGNIIEGYVMVESVNYDIGLEVSMYKYIHCCQQLVSIEFVQILLYENNYEDWQTKYYSKMGCPKV